MASIVVLGKSGQVAKALAEVLPGAKFMGRTEFDMAEKLDLTKLGKPDVIINAAAYTAVDKAESEPELCNRINHIAVAELAGYCAKNNITLVHYSTDYVFNGAGYEPFTEENTKDLFPLNTYGSTKLAGERAIATSGCKYYILRTSWVYSHEGANFVKTMLRLGAERTELKIVNDQIGSPTLAADIAENTLKLLGSNAPYGIYNFVPDAQLSWADFAHMIIPGTKIIPIPSSEYPTPAQRPLNSRLSNKKAREVGIYFPKLEESLNKTLCKLAT